MKNLNTGESTFKYIVRAESKETGGASWDDDELRFTHTYFFLYIVLKERESYVGIISDLSPIDKVPDLKECYEQGIKKWGIDLSKIDIVKIENKEQELIE